MKSGNSLDKLRVVVGAVLLVLYAGATLNSLIDRSFEVPTELHALMAIVAGALFGPSLLKRGGETSDR